MSLKNKIKKLEAAIKPNPPCLITAHSREEAEERLALFNREHPNAPTPVIMIGDQIDKPSRAGLSAEVE